MKPRKLTLEEIVQLPCEWENPKVDIRKYYQNVSRVYEVDEATYIQCKMDGCICQSYKFRYYVAY
jgi:hypothetical protein